MHKADFNERIIYGGVFILFCTIIIIATLHYSPWWGVMDDAGNLNIASNFWKHASVGKFYGLVKAETIGQGRLRPLYYLWVISAYRVFRTFPFGAYLCLALVGLATLLIWGKIINKIFCAFGNPAFSFFVYPLSFFIFTPFWNNFMYISLLEKFVYLFATFSIYLYIRSYEAGKSVYMVVSFILMILGMLSKETGVSLAVVYWVYSVLDLLIFLKNKRLSIISLTANGAIIIGYYFLIRSIWGGTYSLTYNKNLNIVAISSALYAAPLMIKGLFVIAAMFTCAGCAFIVLKKGSFIRQEYILFPLSLGAYLIILAPAAFLNYYLAPIAPFVMLSLYPVYGFIGAGSALRRKACESILIILVFLVLFFIIVPRISKMGDVKKTVSAIISLRGGHAPEKFFLAPGYCETASILGAYTNTSITYLSGGLVDKDMLKDEVHNYLIFEDRCSAVTLRNVRVEKEVYQNKTWRIFSLNKTIGKTSVFMPVFERNLLERIKDRIKVLP